jgi:hypothetical protein
VKFEEASVTPLGPGTKTTTKTQPARNENPSQNPANQLQISQELMKKPYGKCDTKNHIPYGMSPTSLRSDRRFKLRVNLKFCQNYPENSGEETEGHVAQSPRALSRVLHLELKGHLDCRMCPECVLILAIAH